MWNVYRYPFGWSCGPSNGIENYGLDKKMFPKTCVFGRWMEYAGYNWLAIRRWGLVKRVESLGHDQKECVSLLPLLPGCHDKTALHHPGSSTRASWLGCSQLWTENMSPNQSLLLSFEEVVYFVPGTKKVMKTMRKHEGRDPSIINSRVENLTFPDVVLILISVHRYTYLCTRWGMAAGTWSLYRSQVGSFLRGAFFSLPLRPSHHAGDPIQRWDLEVNVLGLLSLDWIFSQKDLVIPVSHGTDKDEEQLKGTMSFTSLPFEVCYTVFAANILC